MRDKADRAAAEGVPLLTYVGTDFDAYFDNYGLLSRFELLDEQYPNSRFILTTRPMEQWLERRADHNRARGYIIDPDGWRAERDAHHAAVLAHFAGRDDLLVMDITSGDGFEKLAPFLGRRPPTGGFPWENRAGAGTYRGESAIAPLRRRARFAVGRVRRRLEPDGF